jgi:hypothetical protein
VVVGLAVVIGLLGAPAAGLAAPTSGALLAPGAGFDQPDGSHPVRRVQRLLRRLGESPGPIDGLYGPRTAGAVQRFQSSHALAADGVVGPQTRGRLTAERRKLRPAKLERKSPAQGNRAESVTERPPASRAGERPNRANPESSTEMAPRVAAVVGALALALLLLVLWRLTGRRGRGPPAQARAGPRLGLVCAGLLAAFAIGAATGAVFATHATPDRGDRPSAAVAEPRLH